MKGTGRRGGARDRTKRQSGNWSRGLEDAEDGGGERGRRQNGEGQV